MDLLSRSRMSEARLNCGWGGMQRGDGHKCVAVKSIGWTRPKRFEEVRIFRILGLHLHRVDAPTRGIARRFSSPINPNPSGVRP